MPLRTLSLDKRGPIAFLTLRRETHDTIDSALLGELPSACEAIEVDEAVRAVAAGGTVDAGYEELSSIKVTGRWPDCYGCIV